MRPGVRMTYEGFKLVQPPAGTHALVDRVTADADLFLVTHMGFAAVDPALWWLDVDGLVDRPLRLTLADLAAMPQREVTSVHECAGSPLTPTKPMRRAGNVVWSGVPLADVLARAWVQTEARFVWSEGLEEGGFAGLSGEPFVKDLPLAKAMAPEVMLATQLNGRPLSDDRGGPVRLVVPGWYGTNSVKWLGRLTLAEERAPGPFTTRFYNDPGPDGSVPVWGIAPESVIVSPDPARPPAPGAMDAIRGWAWAEAGVAEVEVSVDGGATWAPAVLEPAAGFGWQGFHAPWRAQAGVHRLCCRCRDLVGRAQPMDGARNAVHAVTVTV